MKILVTGYKGFIGSHIASSLSEHDVEVYEWEQPYPGVIDYDWVIHIGGISSTTERNIEKIMRQNYDFSCQLFDDCKTFGVNFQFASSASVYGLGLDFREDSPPDPRTPYAWSKYLFERYAMKNLGGNIVQIFRYFNVYGPGEEHKGDQASPFTQFERQVKKTGQVKVFRGSDEFHRDFIHVDKIVSLHKAFLNIPESGIWNFGTGQTMSFMEIAKKFTDNIVEVDVPEKLKDSYQKYTCADPAKLKLTLRTYSSTK